MELNTSKIGLQPPWITYAREVNALFAKDPEVAVDWNEDEYILTLYVDSQEKADALDKLFPNEMEFGNVTISITIVPANMTDRSLMNTFETAFKGNPAVSYTKSVDGLGFSMNYIVFKPEVVQYFNDDLSDVNGFESTLYENIANNVFENHDGIYFCTDIANHDSVGRLYGDWA